MDNEFIASIHIIIDLLDHPNDPAFENDEINKAINYIKNNVDKLRR